VGDQLFAISRFNNAKKRPPPVPFGTLFVDPPNRWEPHIRVSNPSFVPHMVRRGPASAGTTIGSLAGRHRSDKNTVPYRTPQRYHHHESGTSAGQARSRWLAHREAQLSL